MFRLFAVVATCLLLASAVDVRTTYGNEPSSRPNIIVIMTDDQEDGASMAVMKNVRKLITARGVRFQNSFVENPICCPARATLITGQYSHNNLVYSNSQARINGILYRGGYGGLLPTDDNTLPVWLRNAGYSTAMIGKYVNGYSVGGKKSRAYMPPGWDRWFARGETTGLRYFDYTIDDQGRLKSYGSAPADYLTDVQTNEVLSFIEKQRNSDRPFFILFLPSAPHGEVRRTSTGRAHIAPPVPAPRHVGTYASAKLERKPSFNEADISDKPSYLRNEPLLTEAQTDAVETTYRRRLESLLAVDEAVEKIMAKLESTGQADNTVVIFTSDNGYFLGEHRRPEGKLLVYEESIRVPLVISGPRIPQGETRTQLVNNVDLAATIVDLAGATPGRELEGMSLAPILEDANAPWRDFLLFQGLLKYYRRTFGVYRAVRSERYLFVENEMKGGQIERELYDLTEDPYQLQNAYGDTRYARTARELSERLATLKTCKGAVCAATDSRPH